MNLNKRIEFLKQGLGKNFNVKSNSFSDEINISYFSKFNNTIYSSSIPTHKFMSDNIDLNFIFKTKLEFRFRILCDISDILENEFKL